MVADYLSTAIVSGADHANPGFTVAMPPLHHLHRSNDRPPGQGCNQPTFTSLQALGGGPNAAVTVSASVSSQAASNLAQRQAKNTS